MTRTDILNAANKIVNGAREQQYGKPEDNFSTIADLWNAYLTGVSKWGIDIGTVDVANMMILLKIARCAPATLPKADNFVDIAGYAACAGEIVTKYYMETEDSHE